MKCLEQTVKKLEIMVVNNTDKISVITEQLDALIWQYGSTALKQSVLRQVVPQCVLMFTAGRATTDTELEEMLESGNPAIFTQGVSHWTFICSSSGVLLCLHDVTMQMLYCY